MKRRSVYILSGLGLVVVMVAYYFLFLAPLRTQIAETEQTIQTRRNEIVEMRGRLAQMTEAREQAKRNEARFIELAKLLPSDDQIPSVIVELEKLARDAGLTLQTIEPGKPQQATGYKVVPISLALTGEFFDANDFMYRLEQLASRPSRLMGTSAVSLSRKEASPSGIPSLAFSLTLSVYQRDEITATDAPADAVAPGTAQPTPTASKG